MVAQIYSVQSLNKPKNVNEFFSVQIFPKGMDTHIYIYKRKLSSLHCVGILNKKKFQKILFLFFFINLNEFSNFCGAFNQHKIGQKYFWFKMVHCALWMMRSALCMLLLCMFTWMIQNAESTIDTLIRYVFQFGYVCCAFRITSVSRSVTNTYSKFNFKL